MDGAGAYVMLVKGNQPDMLADIQLLFQERHAAAETLTATETVAVGCLPPQRADAVRLLSPVHQHWSIESKSQRELNDPGEIRLLLPQAHFEVTIQESEGAYRFFRTYFGDCLYFGGTL